MKYIVSPAIKSGGNIWNPKKVNFDSNFISLTPTASTKKINFAGLNTGVSIITTWQTNATTGYFPIDTNTTNESQASADANLHRYYLDAGTLKNLRCSYKVGQNPVGTDSCTITIFKNGEATALTATSGDPSTYEPITFADLVNTVTAVDGDYICFYLSTIGAPQSAFSVYLEFYRA